MGLERLETWKRCLSIQAILMLLLLRSVELELVVFTLQFLSPAPFLALYLDCILSETGKITDLEIILLEFRAHAFYFFAIISFGKHARDLERSCDIKALVQVGMQLVSSHLHRWCWKRSLR